MPNQPPTSKSPPSSPPPAPALPKSRKRRAESPAKLTPLTVHGDGELGTLAFGSDGEVSDRDHVLAASDDDEREEAFPELDLAALPDGDGDQDSFDGSVHSSDLEQGDEEDEEEMLRRELEEEQNEISSSSDSEDDDENATLDALLARHTSKPSEYEAEPSAIPGQNRFLGEMGGEEVEETDFMRRAKTVKSELTGLDKTVWEEEIDAGYGSDSSTEETENRVGAIPSYWYDHLPHIGYTIDGQKIARPATSDELDRFLEGVEDESGGWTTVRDKLHHKERELTEEELELVRRLTGGENPDEGYDPYAPTIPYFTSQVLDTPLTGRPEPKSRFLPSKWEHKKVMKLVRAIRSGRITPRRPGAPKAPEAPRFYALWSQSDTAALPHAMHMPAPKLAPPSHDESYNPPEEYLATKEEEDEFEGLDKEDKKGKVLAKRFASLRTVPAYGEFVQERFDRCLDLYLAPRMLRRRPKLDIKDASELLPKLPSPKDLRPFPTTKSLSYLHPQGVRVRCVSIDPRGEWVATGAGDGVVRVWELSTGRCAVKWEVGGRKEDGMREEVLGLEWCPDKEKCLLIAACGTTLHLLSPLSYLSPTLSSRTLQFALSAFNTSSLSDETGAKLRSTEQPDGVAWRKPRETSKRDEGRLLEIEVPGHEVRQVTWHKRGDYFASVASPAGARSVLIHQLSKHHTQAPFAKLKGEVQKVQFHPGKALFFVATQRHVRIYDLMKQQLVKTLNPGLKWISSLDIHPLGDNLLVGSYDRRLVWHDLDLSTTPYKTLKYHTRALRSVSFHPTLPLFCSSSDAGDIHIFHATVYNDLLTNPLIVPLKVLKGHEVKESLGVLEVRWHPREAWCVSVGADGMARLWCN